MKRVFGFLAILCLLTSCSDKEKLTGKRLPVFNKPTDDISFSNNLISIGSYTNPQDCYDGNYNKENIKPGFLFKLQNKILWKFKANISNEDAPNSGIVLAVKNKLYFTDSLGFIYCLDKNNKKLIWKHSSSPSKKYGQIGTYISYGNGKIFVTTSYAELLILDATTGRLFKRIDLDVPAKSPVKYHNGKFFVLLSDNSMKVFEAISFKELWSHSALSEDTGFLGLACVAIADDKVIVPYKTGEIFAININNGELVWNDSLSSISVTESLSAIAHIKAAPVINGTNVYVLSNCGKIACFDLNDGSILWESEIGGTIYTPTLTGNVLLFLSNENDLVALDAHSGNKFWSLHLKAKDTDTIWYNPILITDGIFVINSVGELLIISPKTGAILRSLKIHENITASPTIIDGVLYLFTKNGLVAMK